MMGTAERHSIVSAPLDGLQEKLMKFIRKEHFRYRCNKCGGHAIYLSVTAQDKKGTLSCINCGNTEDAKYGISTVLPLTTEFIREDLKKAQKKECEHIRSIWNKYRKVYDDN